MCEKRRIASLAIIAGILVLITILLSNPPPAQALAGRQQSQFPEAFLYPPYPGSTHYTAIFDHDEPRSETNIDLVTWNGYRALCQGEGITPCTHPAFQGNAVYYDEHNGIDFVINHLPVYAAAEADRVDYAGWYWPPDHGLGYGLYIRLEHPLPEGLRYKTVYAHLSAITLSRCERQHPG